MLQSLKHLLKGKTIDNKSEAEKRDINIDVLILFLDVLIFFFIVHLPRQRHANRIE